MNKILCCLCLFVMISHNLQAQEIPLIISEYSGVNHPQKWLENGVPIPQSAAFDADQLSLWKDGAEVEADFHPLAYWADGNIRWAKLTFKATATDGYRIRTDAPNTTEAGSFTAIKEGDTWTVSTGAIRFTMNESRFNLFDELWISSNADGVYDRQLITSGTSLGPGNLSGSITLIEDGPISKRFFFKENYNSNEVGVYMWITAYKSSGKVTLEYTIRNGKSNVPQSEDGTLHLRMNLGGNVSTQVYGTEVTSDLQVSSVDVTPQKRGADQLGGDNGAVSVLINRFSEMYPRSITLENNGNMNLTLTTGLIDTMTIHGVDIHLNFHPQVWNDEAFKEWADYYEFAYFALPSHQFIEKSYACDGMFVGDAGSVFPGIFGWEEDYTFMATTAGYEDYGENRIAREGNAHGLSDQFATAFNRFLVTRDFDRFLQAEELAIVCMESRGIYMDDVEILLDRTGYAAVDALFGTTGWDNAVNGKMWDSNHRGHYPITEYYYLTGKKRAADAFDNLTKSSKYIFLTDTTTRFDTRPSGYYLSHFARNYSITRSEGDR